MQQMTQKQRLDSGKEYLQGALLAQLSASLNSQDEYNPAVNDHSLVTQIKEQTACMFY